MINKYFGKKKLSTLSKFRETTGILCKNVNVWKKRRHYPSSLFQGDTGYPQAIILSGSSGSGKSYASMVLLRQLFDIAGGGPETDAFKHLAAAFTVLRSLGSARTAANKESSRIVS